MFGREPRKPAGNQPERAQQIHFSSACHQQGAPASTMPRPTRTRQGAHLAQPALGDADFANLLFTFSFWLDIQILEGALTASRLSAST
jgi:ferredoxin-type protein NapH